MPPKYIAQKDFVLSDLSVPFDESVTLTTQATHEFLQHVPVLCSRWQGPVSVAVYAPGTDYAVALDKIAFLRHCDDPCVSANVSWHVVFDKAHAPPKAVKVKTSSSAAFLRSWNGSCASDVMRREYAQFREAHKMTYPINVLRNLARRRARTRYVLASDIELYPSANVIPSFLSLVAERRRRNATEAGAPQVFVLPIFEVQAKQRPPLTKRALVGMLRNKTAIFFQKWLCDQCQKFPKREEWVNYVPADENQLGIFTTTKRDRSNDLWEPIHIGTNDDPFYAEELTWESRKDKMAQNYEMCLRGYDFHILDNAFLVHAPGIKHSSGRDNKRINPFVRKNNARHARATKRLRSRYPSLVKDC
ncbi:beta-1,4-glucuronyltransferase 1-like [Dermacentor variabilis]|uniref:beta-1,4-glucuronyltransferase 1-like n=1 Tax=Dermacentor variabilis TaxID=34621 RepID=UPI003F5BB322